MRRCFKDGEPDEKDALRPFMCVARREGPADDDFRFARRFMKVLNLRGLWCGRRSGAALLGPVGRESSATALVVEPWRWWWGAHEGPESMAGRETSVVMGRRT